MTPERAAAVAATRTEIADRFTHYGIPDPDEKADALVRWMQARGWRVVPELAKPPAPRYAAPEEVATAYLAEARAALDEKRGHRPELGDGCDCRGCRPLAERRPESHGGER